MNFCLRVVQIQLVCGQHFSLRLKQETAVVGGAGTHYLRTLSLELYAKISLVILNLVVTGGQDPRTCGPATPRLVFEMFCLTTCRVARQQSRVIYLLARLFGIDNSCTAS